MKNKQFILVGVILVFIIGLFFNKFFLKGYVPFPGDLLINQYSPWKFESYLGYNPGSYPTKFQYFDVLRQLYPWKVLAVDQFKSGQIPLWNPYNFAGSPLLANLQSQILSPFNILYFIFPYIYSFSIGLLLQIVLAFIFTYLYARKIKYANEAAIFSAVAFSCCLFISVFFQYGVFGQTILWLPLILFGIESINEKFSIKKMLLIIMGIVFAAFGGHLQIFSYLFIFSLLYGAMRFLPKEKKKIMILVFSFCIALGISLVQFFPTLELINLSARSAFQTSYFLEHNLLKINELVLLFSPDFYGNPATNNFLLDRSYPQTAMYIGIIPLIFAISIFFFKKNNLLKFYLATALILLISITNNPISEFFYSLRLPFISSSSPTNGIFILSFSLSILAGYGFNQWINKINIPFFISSLIFFVILIFTYLLHKALNINLNIKNVYYSLIVFGIFFVCLIFSRGIKFRKIFIIVFITLTIFDLFYFFQKFNPFVPRQLVFPDAEIINVIKQKTGINRVWGYGNANIAANTNSFYKFYSPDGYDPLYPKLYGELIYSYKNGNLFSSFDRSTRSDAAINSALGFIQENNNAKKILNLLGIKYIIDRVENGSSEKIFPENNFNIVYDKNGWKLYENKLAVKRAFLTSDYLLYNSNSEFGKVFFSDSFDPSETILLNTKPDLLSQKNQSAGDIVSIKNYNESDIKFDVSANTKKLFFLSDVYYPGWKAYVDGKETSIMQADHAFRSIIVPEGRHEVEFSYNPLAFKYGLYGTIISLVILFIVSGVLYVRKSNYEA